MSTSQTRVVVTEGVTGGIVAPSPRRSVIMDFFPLRIQLHKKKAGTRDDYIVSELDDGSLSTLAEDLDTQALLANLLTTFQELPREDPVGCEDIYQCDISVAIESQGFRWQNLPNQGCAAFPSSIQPSDAQKAAFRNFADKIFALAEKYAARVVEA